MKSKRVLTVLLALCMLVSVLSPAVSATVAGADTSKVQTAANANAAENGKQSSLVVSGENTVSGGPLTLRDTQQTASTETETAQQSGHWTATETEVGSGLSLSESQLPSYIQELREAAEIYDDEDVVAAFIVMEDAPLSESYSSNGQASAAERQSLTAKQDAVIAAIEEEVLHGEALNVRYQFTYLTNAISVRTAFGNLEQIASVAGVKSVFLMPVYDPCTTESAEPTLANSGSMTGVPTVWEDLGYTGTGMKVAVIDSGLDLDHPSFAADPETNDRSLTVEDVDAVLGKLLAAKKYSGLTAEELYYSAKIPYAFNYVDQNLNADHSHDDQGYHGTHVAGIVAANHLEGTDVVGMAPDAQIVVMKVFGENGGAYMDDIVAAIQDAMTLGCDVVNMSLGSPAGFSTADAEIDAIYERIAEQDIIVDVAAGNEGVSSYSNLWGTDLNLTSDPDNATVSSPATYANTTVVASAENSSIMSTYFSVGEDKIGYTESQGAYVTFDSLGYETLEYVMVGGTGTEEDFAAVDVAGKIAVVCRGNISFGQKLGNAEKSGAIGLVVYNNQAGTIAMQLTDEDGNFPDGMTGYVPAVSVSQAAGTILANAESKTLTVSAEVGLVPSADGGQMSSFSSWGVSPDLRLLPDVTGVGGNVYSTIDDGLYETMSGTSMATPQLAGISALVLEYVHANYSNLSDSEIRTLADSLIMSTAVPIVTDSGLEASPRQQGAGLVNAANAVTSGAYLSVPGSDKPKAELYDDPDCTGVYTFTFDINNFSDVDKSYTLDASLLTEDYVNYGGYDFMAGTEYGLSGTVTFDQTNVTVKAGSSVQVEATVALSADDIAWLNEHYSNGGYVEGFIYVNGADESTVNMSLPFLGFFGDWTAAPVLDSAFWTDESFWSADYQGAPEGSEYYNILWTSLGGYDWVPGINPYTGDWEEEAEEHIVFSNNGDGYLDGISEMYISQMRNAKNITITFTDAETGEVYFNESLTYANKTMYRSSYGQVVPTLYSWYSSNMYDFTDGVGKALPNGTELIMTVYANLDYDQHKQNNTYNSWSLPITVDTEAPQLLNVGSAATADGNYITVTVSDNVGVAGIELLNTNGTQLLGSYSGATANEDGTYTVTMDVTDLGTELVLLLGDYGVNESAYLLEYELDDNRPEMDESKLYAYRVMDYSIGDDTMYGWVSMDKETAVVTAQTSDYMEYYALTAAEYAGGYIYAVDAGYNLVTMVPGLWNRNTVRNLGVSVLDLTFDKTTNTMYAVVKVSSYDIRLATMDLATGELTYVKNYGYSGPWSIAAAEDGTIYAIRTGMNRLYTLDKENGYAMNPVTDADGNPISFKSSSNTNLYPYYSQSMTVSDGTLYWAYYPSSSYYGAPALYAINTETYAYTVTPFTADSEYVGLLTLDDGVADYTCDGENCPSAQFTDVKAESYYHTSVDYVVTNGYMVGTTETTFAPNDPMTRAMVVCVLYRMAGSPAVTGECPFTDVPAGSYYEDAVTWASQVDIASGTTQTTFNPYGQITREQLVCFIYRYARYMGYDTTSSFSSLSQFEDASSVAGYAKEAMKWAVGEGLISGTDATHLSPKAKANRAQVACVAYRFYTEVSGGYHLPVNQPLTGVVLSDTELLMASGTSNYLTASPLPWNTQLGEVIWTTSDASMATVEAGVVTAKSAGKATITATVGELSATCDVTVVSIEGSFYAYNYYNYSGVYGDWVEVDVADLPGYTSLDASPVDFIAAEYNGHDGCVYGYDSNLQFYCWDISTGVCTAVGVPVTGTQVMDMAYDYSTGFLYVATFNPSTYVGSVCYVNMNTGALVEMGQSYNIYMTLACSTDGVLYAITAGGELVTVSDVMYDEYSQVNVLVENYLLEGLGTLQYAQSMAYDHNNDTLIWACPEISSLVWIDPTTGAVMYLGDPTASGLFEFVGMTTVPNRIPALDYVRVESVEANDMMILTGATKAADVSIWPLNATNQEVFWSSSNPRVASISDEGMITAHSVGEATITGVLFDGEASFDISFAVTVKESSDNIYGYILADLSTYGGDFWVEMHDSDTTTIDYQATSPYTLYSEEYYNGKLYAYGYDSADWEANFQFIVMDAQTYEIESMTDMGETFPWVYDMAYDYSSGIMYATAGYNETDTDLYIVDMTDGTLIPMIAADVAFMSIAADGQGNLYGITRSTEYSDYETGEYGWTEAELYKIYPEEGTYELVGSTGMQSNMVASMAFDYDNGNLYWAQIFRQDFFSPVNSGLCMVDTNTGKATYLGVVGPAGCQVGGMYILADNYPEEPELVLDRLVLLQSSLVVSMGETSALSAYAIPTRVPADLTWTSSDTSVATVDDQGNVTGVSQGTAQITVTGTYNGVTKSAVCIVTVLSADACFITYSTTNNGFSKVDRKDTTKVELAKADEEGTSAVLAMAYVGETIYGYDVDGKFFSTNDSTFERTYLGAHGVEMDTEAGYGFEVRDVAYNKSTGKLLALGCTVYTDEYGYTYEIVNGSKLYEVNLEDGKLTELCALQDMTQVRGLTVDTDGVVYIYQAYSGGFSTVDVATGVCTNFAPTYNLSVYGSEYDVLSLDYDPVSECIYMLYTGNGSYYQLVTCDTNTCAAAIVGNVGEVYYDEWSYTYSGETFNGLLIKN